MCIRDRLERIRISRKLVELRRDVELPAALDDLIVGEWNLPELLQLFTELEFQLLVDKVKIRMPPADDVIVVPAPEVHQVATVAQAPDARIVIGGDAIRALCEAADDDPRIGRL